MLSWRNAQQWQRQVESDAVPFVHGDGGMVQWWAAGLCGEGRARRRAGGRGLLWFACRSAGSAGARRPWQAFGHLFPKASDITSSSSSTQPHLPPGHALALLLHHDRSPAQPLDPPRPLALCPPGLPVPSALRSRHAPPVDVHKPADCTPHHARQPASQPAATPRPAQNKHGARPQEDHQHRPPPAAR